MSAALAPTRGAVVYFRNGVGNLIQMTPALQALATLGPEHTVDVCLDSAWADSRRDAVVVLLRAMPFVGRVYNFPAEPAPTGHRWWYWTEHSEPSDAMRLFEGHGRPAMHRRGWDKLYTREIDYYLEGVRVLAGWSGTAPGLFCPVADTPTLPDVGDRLRIALCNGSFGKMGRVKHWPYFADLSRTLRAYYEAEIVGVGSGDELRGVSLDIDYVGKVSITETARVLTQCTLLVTVDTGLMHVADALRVPMITLWGGTLVSKNGPTASRVRIVRAGLPCQPCQYSPAFDTCEHVDCMKQLTMAEVMRNVRALLS